MSARGGASVQILTERAGWAPQAQFVNQTLVSARLIFARRRRCTAPSGTCCRAPIRRCRRYLRLIDRKSRIWFHVLEKEISMTPATVTERRTEQSTDKTAIRPFRFEAADAELDEMRRRITATRFPERETVADFSQGVQLAFIQALARYWATDYDWRNVEAKLNSYPNFLTEID